MIKLNGKEYYTYHEVIVDLLKEINADLKNIKTELKNLKGN